MVMMRDAKALISVHALGITVIILQSSAPFMTLPGECVWPICFLRKLRCLTQHLMHQQPFQLIGSVFDQPGLIGTHVT